MFISELVEDKLLEEEEEEEELLVDEEDETELLVDEEDETELLVDEDEVDEDEEALEDEEPLELDVVVELLADELMAGPAHAPKRAADASKIINDFLFIYFSLFLRDEIGSLMDVNVFLWSMLPPSVSLLVRLYFRHLSSVAPSGVIGGKNQFDETGVDRSGQRYNVEVA
jgi:hypothetical protein